MLDCDHQVVVADLIEKMECRVKLPKKIKRDFFDGQGEVHDGYDDRRRFVRRKLRTKGILEIGQSLPQIEREHQTFSVIVSDISRGGFGFFHHEQIFPQESFKLWLPTKPFPLIAARCERLGEECFLIGAFVVLD